MNAARGGMSSDALDEMDAGYGGERADRSALGLAPDRGDDLRVRVPVGAHADATDEVEQDVAVHVGDRRPPRVIDDDARRHGVRLEARCDVSVFARAKGAALRAG